MTDEQRARILAYNRMVKRANDRAADFIKLLHLIPEPALKLMRVVPELNVILLKYMGGKHEQN